MSTDRHLLFTAARERLPASDRYVCGIVVGLAWLITAAGCGSPGTAAAGGSGNLGGTSASGGRGGSAVSSGGVTGRGGAVSSGGTSSGGAIGTGGASAGGGGASAGGAAAATGGAGDGGRGGGAGGPNSPGGRGGSAAGSSGSAGGHAGGAGKGGHAGNAISSGGRGGTTGTGGQVAGCAFSTTYAIVTSQVDGKALHATLSPPASFTVELRDFLGSAKYAQCSPALPACQTDGAIDAADVIAAMANPDVKRALGQLVTHYPPVSDGPMLTVGRASDSHEIIETLPCTFDCTPAPDGARALLTLMRNLLAQQLADATCKDVTNPDGGLSPFPIARN